MEIQLKTFEFVHAESNFELSSIITDATMQQSITNSIVAAIDPKMWCAMSD